MNKLIKKFIFFLSINIFIFYNISYSFASNISVNPSNIMWPYYKKDILSDSAIIIDANSKTILYEKNIDKKIHPASLTKLMTALVVFDKVTDYDELVTFSYNAITDGIERGSTVVGAQSGDRLTVKECLYSILLPSANDAANALAEHFAGNIYDFVLLMNEKAEQLGLKNTHFENPTGLHNDKQFSTARDLSKIMIEIMKNPIFKKMSSSISFSHRPIKRYKDPDDTNNTILTTNNLIIPGSKYYYKYAIAGKTGYLKESGYNLVAATSKDNIDLICVTLGADKIEDRFIDTKNLSDFYFNNYKSILLKDVDWRFSKNYANLKIKDIDIVKSLEISVDNNAHITVPNNVNFKDITSKISFVVTDRFDPYAIGNITYYLGEKPISTITLKGINDNSYIPIFTNNLDINSTNTNNTLLQKKDEFINKDAPITITDDKKIIFSNSFILVLKIFLILTILVILIRFLISRSFFNFKTALNKFKLKLRRYNRYKKNR